MTKRSIIGAEVKHFRSHGFIRLRNKLLPLQEPLLMGIVNLTPDSFFEQSRFHEEDSLAKYLSLLTEYGFTFVDLGANSTRPGSKKVTPQEQIKRLGPALTYIRKNFPQIFISIDTSSSVVASWALQEGADLINDVEGGNNDPELWKVCGKFNAPYILTHSRGTQDEMHEETAYENVTTSVLFELSQNINRIQEAGVKDIIIDPGFGFSKTLEQNYELLQHLSLFQIFERPILCGFSRKSMIYKKIKVQPQEALNGTSVLNTLALTKGCDILRVHDPREAFEVIALLKM